MHRRHAAQRGEAQIQRCAGLRIERRHHPCGAVVGVLDHADQVGAVQPARLGRDVRRREAQPQIARVARVGLLGQHQAVALGIEAVDLHPPEAGDSLDLAYRQPAQRVEIARILQFGDEGAHHRVEVVIGVVRAAGADELDDQLAGEAMGHQGKALLLAVRQVEAQVAQMEGIVVVVAERLQSRRQLQAREQGLQALAEQRLGRLAQPLLDLLAGLDDLQLRLAEHQQEAVRLDASGDVDRLVGAVSDGLFEALDVTGDHGVSFRPGTHPSGYRAMAASGGATAWDGTCTVAKWR